MYVCGDLVDFLSHFGVQVRLLAELEHCPGEHCSGGFVSCDEHGHEVVSQLLGGRVLSSHVDQESQQTGVLHRGVVALLQLVDVLLVLGGQRLHDQLVQHSVQELQVSVESSQAGNELVGEGEVPIG